LNIVYPPEYLGSAIAFYSIVHLPMIRSGIVFGDIYRVLNPGGNFLFSFHSGDEIVHFDKAHDKEVDIDLFFFKTDDKTDMSPLKFRQSFN